MIYKEHYLEIIVNGQLLELESQNSLNLRLNNTLFEPTEIGSNQSEYSFSFEIPSTPNNDKIFDYANDLAKTNKFHQRRAAEVYADGQLIFKGTLLVNGYKDKNYQCNLVSIKVYSLEDIFGEATFKDVPYDVWNIPFDGVPTINAYNASNLGVTFPLISYGVFEKTPYFKDEVANDYTPKHNLDKWNKWYVESFYPSLNMLESIKRLFEWKGYNVAGDVFNDEYLNNIYMSCNLADEQVPTYNLGNPKIGSVDLRLTFTTNNDDDAGYVQELQFPYYHLENRRAGFYGAANVQTNTKKADAWNFENIVIYDLLDKGTKTFNINSYMFDPDEKCIVIPADGYYKIFLSVSTTLDTTQPTFTAAQNVITNGGAGDDIEYVDITGITKNLYETCPVEVQLVRNYEDNIELIKGKWNKQYVNGNPTQTAYTVNGVSYNNINEWQTCYPFEDAYQSTRPTKTNDLALRNTYSPFGGSRTSSSSVFGGSVTRGGSRTSGSDGDFGRDRRGNGGTPRNYNYGEYGYVYKDGEIMAYDAAVNGNFICGFSSMGVATKSGARAVLKNGYSWSKTYSNLNEEFYNEPGYLHLYRDENDPTIIKEEDSAFNQNTYSNTPPTFFFSNATQMSGTLACCVWLNKNDILELFQIHRDYETANGTPVRYSATTMVNLRIEAASPSSYAMLRSRDFNYLSPSEFDYNLRLFNFMNEETTVASHIQSVIDAFNIEMTQEGKNVWFNTKKNVVNNLPAVVDLDNRANSNDAETQNIEYPSSMAVKYRTDVEEYGYWLTIPEEKRNEEDWKEYGDSGFTVIQLSDDDYNVESNEKSLNYSYTWYDNFNWVEVDSAKTENSGNTLTLTMPVISKYSYMAEGYNYDESMKHDGFSLAQRFWYKPTKTDAFVWTSSYPTEKVDIYVPSNIYNGLNLSYKNNEYSVLTKYFNLRPYLSSNYVIIDVYLTPEEYKLIKNGGNVLFDTELYAVTEIEGYDPTNSNLTTLKLLKLT